VVSPARRRILDFVLTAILAVGLFTTVWLAASGRLS
jgi:hypothetical protein